MKNNEEDLKNKFKQALISTYKAISLDLNKCDDIEKNIIAEYYQRCFGEDLPESMINVQV